MRHNTPDTIAKIPASSQKAINSMDIRWFLKQRLDFIRTHYDGSASTFIEKKRQIEDGQAPFDNPPYSEDGEPPFLNEWIDADTSIDLVGIACVSLLSDALKLYFNLIKEEEFRFEFDATENKALKNGFVGVFKNALGEILNTDWLESSINFDVIEQTVLARNQGQHGSDLTSFRVRVDPKTIERHPRPFFVRPEEAEAMADAEMGLSKFLQPSIKISRDSLFTAIDEVEKLGDWVEKNRDRARPWFDAKRAKRQM
jgi:hypothetical protein